MVKRYKLKGINPNKKVHAYCIKDGRPMRLCWSAGSDT
jgi:hypothetical protein